jgi:hypothetical protein
MSASPRDLLKPRSQRLLEVAHAIQQQVGFADSQYVTFGCVLAPGGTNTQLAIGAGEYSLGQGLIELPAVTGQVLTGLGLTNTGAGQTCLVLVEADATQPIPVLTFTQGAIVNSGTPVLPSPTASRIVLGYLNVPASFTFGTTPLTAGGTSLAPSGGVCVTMSYDKGNANPAGTQSGSGSTGGF